MDPVEEIPNNSFCPPKHGLSGWMKNLGRLGNTTNFEEYGSSPPEIDSTFLVEYPKIKQNTVDQKENFLTNSAEECLTEKPRGGSFSNSFLYDPQLNNGTEQGHTHLPVPALSSLLLESLTDDTSSSTDTTPFVTPQGSPLIPRRITAENMHNSLSKELAAISTRKWLCKGFVPEGNDVSPQIPITKKRIKHPGNVSPTSKGKRCNVSNFDINALSPSSW